MLLHGSRIAGIFHPHGPAVHRSVERPLIQAPRARDDGNPCELALVEIAAVLAIGMAMRFVALPFIVFAGFAVTLLLLGCAAGGGPTGWGSEPDPAPTALLVQH